MIQKTIFIYWVLNIHISKWFFNEDDVNINIDFIELVFIENYLFNIYYKNICDL